METDLSAVAGSDFPRLDRALADAFPAISRTRWKDFIRKGFVSVDGVPAADADAPVPAGAVLSCTLPPPPPAPGDAPAGDA
ncbi:MAG: hypothetical protein IJS32_08435, partial [Kiritimatiellae bacterium]|nr:hypothetical protein [Kiritimatiellia bacterium]